MSFPTFFKSVGRHTSQTFWCTTRRATPVLFAFTMGTGAVSSLFLLFPYGGGSTPMLVFSKIFFYLDLSTFVCFLILTITKYTIYPGAWHSLLRNPTTSLYAGCFPMGAATLITVAVKLFHDHAKFGGRGFLVFLWAMWWIDVGISFICCWVGVHVMIIYQSHSLESMSATWLLPVVTLIVASSTGGILSHSLLEYNDRQALDTLTVSVFMVTVGLSLALMILVIYLQRLITCGILSERNILSVFIPLGPTGQAGYSILLIGEAFRMLLPRAAMTNSYFLSAELTPTIIDVCCVCISFMLWSLATMWIIYGFLALYPSLRRFSIPFKITSWGLVFPNGVYATHTIRLSDAFDSKVLRVWGALWAGGTLILWLCLFCRSVLEMKIFMKTQEDSSQLRDSYAKEITPGATPKMLSTTTLNQDVV